MATHIAFSSLGAALTIGIIWVLSGGFGWLSAMAGSAVLLCFGIAGVLRDAGLMRLKLPENRRLIPQHALRGGAVKGAARFSFELGTGVRTYLSATGPYVLALGILLASPRPQTLVGIAIGFGIGRSLPLMLISTGSPSLAASLGRITTWKPTMTGLCALAVVIAAIS